MIFYKKYVIIYIESKNDIKLRKGLISMAEAILGALFLIFFGTWIILGIRSLIWLIVDAIAQIF